MPYNAQTCRQVSNPTSRRLGPTQRSRHVPRNCPRHETLCLRGQNADGAGWAAGDDHCMMGWAEGVSMRTFHAPVLSPPATTHMIARAGPPPHVDKGHPSFSRRLGGGGGGGGSPETVLAQAGGLARRHERHLMAGTITQVYAPPPTTADRGSRANGRTGLHAAEAGLRRTGL